MHKILKEIVTKTQEDIREFKQSSSAFSKTIISPKQGSIAIIAEIKLSSPTMKNLGKSSEIKERAKKYELGGADCISVVGEKHFFNGDPKYIKFVKQAVSLPVLYKDFIIDPYQIFQAKQMGADAILLIARILSGKDLMILVNLANEIGLEPVVEINNEDDFKKSKLTKTNIIAVNARDLDSFEVNVDKACRLLKKIPKKFIKLGFSGVKSKAEMEKYKDAGADGILIGTSLMEADNVRLFIEGIRI